MKINYGYQITLNDLSNLEIDIFICANNNEARKYCLFDKIKRNNFIKKSISLYYNNVFDSRNDLEYKQIKKHTEVERILDDEIKACKKEELTIIVDYSCMTKSWYYTILLYLSNSDNAFKKINCYLSYTPSRFSLPLAPKPNSDISPLPGKIIMPNNRPKALILGLGYEENKAQGIIDQIDPAKIFLLYSKPTIDKRFTEAIEINNANVINDFEETTYTYDFSSLLDIENKLRAIYYKYNTEYNIIISPIGPKPFTLVSMILSIIFPEIEIWRIGSGEDINPYPREPFNEDHFIICEIVYKQNQIT